MPGPVLIECNEHQDLFRNLIFLICQRCPPAPHDAKGQYKPKGGEATRTKRLKPEPTNLNVFLNNKAEVCGREFPL